MEHSRIVFEKDPCEDARSQGWPHVQQGSKAARRLGILDECVDRASVRYCDRWMDQSIAVSTLAATCWAALAAAATAAVEIIE